MVSNSAQLDRRTKQHTEFGVSASNSSRDMGRTKSWRKKKKKEKRKKKKKEKNEHRQNYIASPTGIANNNNNNNINNETGSRLPCMRPRSDPRRWKTLRRTKSWRRKKKKKLRSKLDGKQQSKIRPQDQATHSILSLCE